MTHLQNSVLLSLQSVKASCVHPERRHSQIQYFLAVAVWKKNTHCKCYNTFLLSLTQTVACIFFATCKANFCTILVQHDMHLTSIAIETASFQKGWWCVLCKECQVDRSWILKRVAFGLDCDWMESANDVYCTHRSSSQRPFVVYIMAVIQVSSFLPHLPILV